jgi:TRAP-type C4-dicarboxylate transport system permease small subunit
VSNTAAPETGSEELPVGHGTTAAGEGLVERTCGFLAKLTLVAMMVIIGAEVLLRNTVHYSWEGTDEVGSYLVVAVTFLCLATCQAYGGYHELQIVKMRLPRRLRSVLNVVLLGVCLIASLILLWQYSRLVMMSWNSGEASMTSLRIPLWIPQLTMPLGIAALCFALAKSILIELKAALTSSSSAPAGHAH